jgi:hypothetical protein
MQRAGKAAAQAQAVREAEITAQESLELTKALLRVAVHHVSCCRSRPGPAHLREPHPIPERRWNLCPCFPDILQVSYLRGIFPEDNYRKVDMKNLDSECTQRLCSQPPPPSTHMGAG